MAIIHGKDAVLYMGQNTAVPVAETSNFTISFATEFAEASSHGAKNIKRVPGLADGSGSVTKFYDDAAFTIIDAALNGTLMRMYAYPSRNNTSNYVWGLAYLGLNELAVPVDELVTESYDLVAAGDWKFQHT